MKRLLEVVSHSEEETMALAEKLAARFQPGEVLVLTGPLGAGKTVFVRGLAKALGIDQQSVSSPSFTMVNEYPGRQPLYHFDLYRVTGDLELPELGWDDYLERNGVIAIEWGEKAENYLPDTYYRIAFELVDDRTRRIGIQLVTNKPETRR